MKALLCLLAAATMAFAADKGRVVSAGGSITETIYALGAQDSLVAVDISSLYPKEAEALPKVGYARQLSAEGILSVNPTLVLAHDDAGPPDVLTQIEAAGVKVVKLPNGHTSEIAIDRILKIGDALNKKPEAEALVATLKADLAQAQELAAKATTKPKVLFIYTRGGGVMNVSGTDTAADAMIELAGATNAVKEYTGYKPLTAEAAVAAAPDVILVTEHGLQSAGGIDEFLKQPGLILTPAGQARRVVSMDDVLLLGFGPRLGKAALELNEKLHAKQADLARQ